MVKYMRRISVDSIKGNEKLAKNIWSSTDIVLMSEGTILKREYIPRLKELDINYVYIEDELAKGIKIDEIIEVQIKEQCQDTIRNTIERYFYSNSSELVKLKDIAEEIILDILEQPEVMYNISGIRDKSESIYSHSLNVCALAVLISLKMKIPKQKVNEIAVGSLLLDIGYNYIGFDYSEKNYNEFTENELKEIKKHVIYGYSAVEKEKWLSNVSKDIILCHHERLDGNGYPLHIKGDKIKIGTKIVAVCDAFDRLVYGTFTRKMKVHEAIEYIVGQSDILFDKTVVSVFMESVAAYPIGSTVITNENEIGIVLRQNNKLPARPVLRMLYDNDGNLYEEWTEKDLTKFLTLFIKDTVENI